MKRYVATSIPSDLARPLVALVGRPNVGKSSLFNRLVGGRPALVEDMPGVTRDRRYGVVDWPGWRFRIVDTGGLDPSAHGILGAMRTQTLRAVEEADVLVLVVDAIEGLTGVDRDVVALLRRSGKPVILAVNKVDSVHRESALSEVYALGFADVFAVSAGHGRGMGELLDRIVELLGPKAAAGGTAAAEFADGHGDADADPNPDPDADVDPDVDDDVDDGVDDDPGLGVVVGASGVNEEEANAAGRAPDDLLGAAAEPGATAAHVRGPEGGPIRIAFVGKPNVGKSSLVNRLLGEDRVLVHDMPGTTRDPIDTPFSVGGKDFVLVDTAGLRRRRSVDTLTEAVAGKMARDQLARCDVAVLVIDSGGATVEDAKIAGLIEDSGRGVIIILNKKDVVPKARINSTIEATKETLSFLTWAPVLMTSAVTGAGVARYRQRPAAFSNRHPGASPPGEVNRFLETILTDKPPPAGPNGRHVRLYFATQAQIRPPTFVFSANHPLAVPVSYRRFLSNQIRQAYGFEGTPVRIVMRAHRKRNESRPPERT